MKHLLDIPCDEMQANCHGFNLFNDMSSIPAPKKKKEYLMCLNSRRKYIYIYFFLKLSFLEAVNQEFGQFSRMQKSDFVQRLTGFYHVNTFF